MSDPLVWHRLQFAFTVVFHYLLPQLTMGLALLLVAAIGAYYALEGAHSDHAARFLRLRVIPLRATGRCRRTAALGGGPSRPRLLA